MKSLVSWAEALVVAYGAPGLYVIALLDSSLVSLPEINDLLVIGMVTQQPARLVLYATMATLGSVTGCLLLYLLARQGGEAFVRRRFHERHVERGLELFRRFGLLAVLIPAILPPPAPFKIFVLLAGVARVRLSTFVVAVAAGRAIRYFGEGLLAVWYGQEALDYVQGHGEEALLGLAVLLAAAAAWYFWRRTRQAPRAGAV